MPDVAVAAEDDRQPGVADIGRDRRRGAGLASGPLTSAAMTAIAM